jgi:hypothetical protein
MVSQLKGGDTLLTGLLDQSALYGVLAEIEALGLDRVEAALAKHAQRGRVGLCRRVRARRRRVLR